MPQIMCIMNESTKLETKFPLTNSDASTKVIWGSSSDRISAMFGPNTNCETGIANTANTITPAKTP